MSVRHARHLLLAEIGEAGQARLEATPIDVVGDARAAETARSYLERAGVEVRAGARPIAVPDVRPGRPELEEAAAFVAGAFAAVEAIKDLVGAGHRAEALHVLLTGPERAENEHVG